MLPAMLLVAPLPVAPQLAETTNGLKRATLDRLRSEGGYANKHPAAADRYGWQAAGARQSIARVLAGHAVAVAAAQNELLADLHLEVAPRHASALVIRVLALEVDALADGAAACIAAASPTTLPGERGSLPFVAS